jgi:hypothetical protein
VKKLVRNKKHSTKNFRKIILKNMKTLDKNSTKLLKSYKKDLKKFIRNNDLDSEFYEDIEERIEEKINLLEDPSFDDIKNILAEI